MHGSHILLQSSYQKGIVGITQKQTGATLAVTYVLTGAWFSIPFTLQLSTESLQPAIPFSGPLEVSNVERGGAGGKLSWPTWEGWLEFFMRLTTFSES